MTDTIRYDRGADGIVTLTLDDPDQSANTMNRAYAASMSAMLDRLEAERDELTGVIVTSAKSTFFAGGDLPEMVRATRADAPALAELLGTIKRDLRRLETLGRPVVAAVNGSALGGGLEIALACHHRVALDAPGSRLGLPEVTLGLLPGAGGVTRTVRMLGLAGALTTVLLTGRRMRPTDALSAGLVDEVVATPAELLDRARAWIAANPRPSQPWDRPDYRMPGGTPASRSLAAQLPAFPATLRKQLKGARLPAPEAILATAVEGAQVDLETAFTVETRHLIGLLTGQIAKNMIGAFFFDLKAVNGGAARPSGVDAAPVRRVAVLGAGMMGAGIAYACASAGLDVVVKDVSAEAAGRAREHAERLLARKVRKGRATEADARAVLDRITTTDRVDALAGCDAVIEAVFEDPALKRSVFAEVLPVLAPDALLASNTSTLPITGLATGVDRPADFIGMHFFSPVDRMPLLEIVVGERTGDAALARAFDLGRRIGKTPIVVNDGRGFFTSRVIGRFIDEAVGMVAEGVPAASVEQAALQAGYPTGPLALADEVSLTLIQRIRRQFEAAGEGFLPLPAHRLVDELVDAYDRPGRAAGRGFYGYADGTRGRLWTGLAELTTDAGRAVPFTDLQERMLFAEALDALRCLDEGVLRTETDANIGSILGIGFPAWTGGVIRYVRQYAGGPAGFAARAAELAARYGDRFEPPTDLVERLASSANRPTEAVSAGVTATDRPAGGKPDGPGRGGPLAGVRVVELASLAPAPFGCMVLADLGADVVRVDRPGGPAAGRLAAPTGGPLQRGRRVTALDLKSPAGLADLLRLVERADVLVEAYRPGVAERLGFGPETCRARNPRLVYARMTGWGQDGPLAPRAGHDIDYIAVAGALEPLGRAGERPYAPMNLLGDFGGGGMLLAVGVLAALLERERSGSGQVVDAAMVDGSALLTAFLHGLLGTGLWAAPRGRNMFDGGAPFYDTYRTADGGFMAVGAMEPAFYAELLTGLGLADEPDLPAQYDPSGWDELRRRFTERFAGRTRNEWTEVFADLDACVAPVLAPREAHRHPHNAARGTFVEVGGEIQPAPAPRFDRTPTGQPAPAPDPEHDVLPVDTILADWR